LICIDENGQYQLQLTARAYHRVLKLARTIADLAGSEATIQVHPAEALQYRPKLDLMKTILVKNLLLCSRLFVILSFNVN